MENQNLYRSLIVITEFQQDGLEPLYMVTPLFRQDAKFVISDFTLNLATTSLFVISDKDCVGVMREFVSDLSLHMAWINENYTNIKSINSQCTKFDTSTSIFPSVTLGATKVKSNSDLANRDTLYQEVSEQPRYVDKIEKIEFAGINIRDYRTGTTYVSINGDQDPLALCQELGNAVNEFHKRLLGDLLQQPSSYDHSNINTLTNMNVGQLLASYSKGDLPESGYFVVSDDTVTLTDNSLPTQLTLSVKGESADSIAALSKIINDPVIHLDDSINQLITNNIPITGIDL